MLSDVALGTGVEVGADAVAGARGLSGGGVKVWVEPGAGALC